MASLALLQGYSSAEDEEDDNVSSSFSGGDEDGDDSERSDEDEDDEVKIPRSRRRKRSSSSSSSSSYRPPPAPAPNSSLLPSALDAFAEIAGPPEFLNNAVGYGEKRDEVKELDFRARSRARRDKTSLPAGVVVEAKAQLVGIRDRVRSDVEGSSPAPATANTTGEGKRVVSASNPEAKDAADLLRMCLQCGVPKTYSHTQGMVCPICGDRPSADLLKEPEKKKGSAIKDKEKSKRMKGQSSHATWKSETEMQLRQQFD